ncbi:hypothetical protein NB636_04695 [Oxalobacter aliiformigenes]|uniref:hypothetical protein n=1 Tax=Oxalobacter aliiformigenes TaxID=2946593 RepID=UPI0022AEA470|nr:hypothetical protein [Oxalobacter aliiformigenes]WAW00146.1 hypothetical protein NB636_04695 [Oxalobacter aliiformigenes]
MFSHAKILATARQPDSPTARQPDSPTARQPDSPTARQPDSPTARQPDSLTARLPDRAGSVFCLFRQAEVLNPEIQEYIGVNGSGEWIPPFRSGAVWTGLKRPVFNRPVSWPFRSGCLRMVLWLCGLAGSADVLVVTYCFPDCFSRQRPCLHDSLREEGVRLFSSCPGNFVW